MERDLQNGEVFILFQISSLANLSIHSNAHALARYSSLVQESGMVPIVEPEVLMDGEHTAEDCLNKTSEVLKNVLKN